MNIRYNTSSEDQRYKTEEANTYIYIYLLYIYYVLCIYIQSTLNGENSGLWPYKLLIPTKMLSQIPSDLRALNKITNKVCTGLLFL